MSKKILGIFYILFLTLLVTAVTSVKGSTNYRFDIVNQEIKFIDGMEHRRVNGDMTFGLRETKQYYNYININNSRTGYHLVSIDSYTNGAYGMQSLATFINKYETENPNNEVLAAVNGDFYHINTSGQSIGTHIRDYEVIVPGDNNAISLVTDNKGKSEFRPVRHDGLELIVYNEYNEIKYRNKVNKQNQDTNNNNEVTVLFDNYLGQLPTGLDLVFISGNDVKPREGRNTSHNNYYGYAKGTKVSSIETNTVPEKHFVIINEEVSNLIEDGDKVVFQAKIKGFEDVASAVSTSVGRGPLVVNGIVDPVVWDEAHPRTAIGIKENGDIFFIVVDGRDRVTPKHGVFLSEFAHLMKSYGAVDAYNFDGGGSSTLMLKNGKTEGTVLERFDVLNDLSDGRLRSLSNGYLVVKGDLKEQPINISGIENRTKFEVPTNVFIDENLNLNFDEVVGATRYEVFVNGKIFETSKNIVPLKGLHFGDNLITVRVKGTIANSTSDETKVINYKVFSNEINSLLNLLKKYNK